MGTNIEAGTIPGSRPDATIKIEFYANPKPTTVGNWTIQGLNESLVRTESFVIKTNKTVRTQKYKAIR